MGNNEQRILVFSGKKGSGKSTLANFCEYIFKYGEGSFKQYAFADKLKEMCVDIFGIGSDQIYGDEELKNILTDYEWERMPDFAQSNWRDIKSGKMTAREFLQYLGTEVFRKIDRNIWARSCLLTIKREKYKFTTISDCRFPEEVLMAKQHNAKVIRLTRAPYEDLHSSETALDENNFNWDLFNYVINNNQQTQAQTYAELIGILGEWGWL